MNRRTLFRWLLPTLACAALQFACQNSGSSAEGGNDMAEDSVKTIIPDRKPTEFVGLNHQDSMNAGLLISEDSYSIEDDACNYVAEIDTIISPDGSIRDYEPDMGTDHWPGSWWTPKQHRDGVGAVLEIRFPGTIPVCAIELYGGAADNEFEEGDTPPRYTDLYHLNNRIKSGTIEFSDGTQVPFSREDEQHWITLNIPPGIKSSFVRLRITDVYKGTKWNDLALGDIQVLTNNEQYGYILDGIAKPVIYLYPEQPESVRVTLELHGKLGTTWPVVSSDAQWNVLAHPDGLLQDIATGRTHRYLFWEGNAAGTWDMGRGFCVPGSQTAAFLTDATRKLGLNDLESNDFISYWLPMMEGNAWNLIHFAGEEYTRIAQLHISPEPNQVLRVFMVWQPSEKEVSLIPQPLIPVERKGFTVVEWGGCRLPARDLLSGK